MVQVLTTLLTDSHPLEISLFRNHAGKFEGKTLRAYSMWDTDSSCSCNFNSLFSFLRNIHQLQLQTPSYLLIKLKLEPAEGEPN